MPIWDDCKEEFISMAAKSAGLLKGIKILLPTCEFPCEETTGMAPLEAGVGLETTGDETRTGGVSVSFSSVVRAWGIDGSE